MLSRIGDSLGNTMGKINSEFDKFNNTELGKLMGNIGTISSNLKPEQPQPAMPSQLFTGQVQLGKRQGGQGENDALILALIQALQGGRT
jgi:hypothetical protein